MKSVFVFFIFILLFASCGIKKSERENLPKDIALRQKPVSDSITVVKKEEFDPGAAKKMQDLREEIESLIASETCTDISQWRISPLGAKPCGGPTKYIAYPKSKESEILSKIKDYTTLQTAYNKAHNLTSDCIIVLPPSGIKCENGYAVLVQSKPASNSPKAE